ncbi:hypothetical protein BJX96DRAFT_182328 [Aspergillus floccosus]
MRHMQNCGWELTISFAPSIFNPARHCARFLKMTQVSFLSPSAIAITGGYPSSSRYSPSGKLSAFRHIQIGHLPKSYMHGIQLPIQDARDQTKEEGALKRAWEASLRASQDQISSSTGELMALLLHDDEEIAPELRGLASLITRLHRQWPNDIGLFAVFFMNYVTLTPGEALFVQPNELHAYLSGDAVECMASSANVVRGGFTKKKKDIETLVSMPSYSYHPPATPKIWPLNPYVLSAKGTVFSVLYESPAEEFDVVKTELSSLDAEVHFGPIQGPSMMICLQGGGEIAAAGCENKIETGSILFISAATARYLLSMIVVTGGAGFVGSNIVKALNERNRKDIVVVDDMNDGSKFVNLVDCEIADYLDADDFRKAICANTLGFRPEVIFHNGACSSTTEMNGKYMLDINFTMSKELFHYCQRNKTRFIYASSAAVYGSSHSPATGERTPQTRPLNIYGYSKMLFDQYVDNHLVDGGSQVVGLRYFNVYGPREQHKGAMASIVYQVYQQLQETGGITLFGEYDGYQPGMQQRDFIHVDDVVKVNLYFFDNPSCDGIFDVGKGHADTFIDMAAAVQKICGKSGQIGFKPFPEHLKGRYQSFTCADVSQLRRIGFGDEFKSIQDGVCEYGQWLMG